MKIFMCVYIYKVLMLQPDCVRLVVLHVAVLCILPQLKQNLHLLYISYIFFVYIRNIQFF